MSSSQPCRGPRRRRRLPGSSRQSVWQSLSSSPAAGRSRPSPGRYVWSLTESQGRVAGASARGQ